MRPVVKQKMKQWAWAFMALMYKGKKKKFINKIIKETSKYEKKNLGFGCNTKSP